MISAYDSYRYSGDWHVHTDYSHGTSSVAECVSTAKDFGLSFVAITEHVRRAITYDYGDFVRTVADAASDNLLVVPGCEAKVLADGTLDIPNEVLSLSQLNLMAFHAFNGGVDEMLDAASACMANYPVHVWAHPFMLNGSLALMSNTAQRRAIDLCREHEVLLEINKQYATPDKAFVDRAKVEVGLVFGSNAHHRTELLRADEISNLRSEYGL